MHFCHRRRLGRFDKLLPLIEFVPSGNRDDLCWIIHAHNTKATPRTFCCRADLLCGPRPCGDKGVSVVCRYVPTIDNLDHRVGPSNPSADWFPLPGAFIFCMKIPGEELISYGVGHVRFGPIADMKGRPRNFCSRPPLEGQLPVGNSSLKPSFDSCSRMNWNRS
jgi:hypothetical protein